MSLKTLYYDVDYMHTKVQVGTMDILERIFFLEDIYNIAK